MIRLEGVHKRFGGTAVLTDVSLHVPPGGTLGLIGEGGAGKSLILKLICGLIDPDAGRVVVDGVEINRLDEPDRMAIRGRIGMIFQNYALFDYLTVGENIAFAAPARRGRPGRRRRPRRAPPGPGPPAHHRGQAAGRAVGGMKKRVCLARATIHDPPIMLCDDPTAGLDPVTTNRIFALLKQLQAENRATAIIVSHEVDALRPICDRFAMLERGKLIFEGTAAEARHAAPPCGAS
ncbi:MAG: ATP-binding cassette domain-containing protein [bacterium]